MWYNDYQEQAKETSVQDIQCGFEVADAQGNKGTITGLSDDQALVHWDMNRAASTVPWRSRTESWMLISELSVISTTTPASFHPVRR